MKNYQETLEALLSNLSYETSEILDYPVNLYDKAHEHADNHENVIYTAKAHDNARNATSEELSEAESRLEELGGVHSVNGSSTYDSAAILLSYHLEEMRFSNLVRDELEELKEGIDNLIHELMEAQDDCEEEEQREELAAMENELAGKLDTIDEIIG